MQEVAVGETGENVEQPLLQPVHAPKERTCLQKYCCLVHFGVCFKFCCDEYGFEQHSV